MANVVKRRCTMAPTRFSQNVVPLLDPSLAPQGSTDTQDSSSHTTYLKENPDSPSNAVFASGSSDNCALPSRPWKAVLRGKNVVEPYVDIQSFPMLKFIEKGLDGLKVTDINSLQRCAWPQVFRGRNTLIVGGPSERHGKTLSYLVPIAVKVLRLASVKHSGAKGPIAIIMCGSTLYAKKIEIQLSSMVGKAVTIYRASLADQYPSEEMSKNPDVILCKPDFMKFLGQTNLLEYDRLRYFIADDVHILQEEFGDTVPMIFAQLSRTISAGPARRCGGLQFILCGAAWNATMEAAFITSTPFSDPVLVIGSFTQALKYGNVRILVRFADEMEKAHLAGAITETCNQQFRHVVIVCQTREKAFELSKYLKDCRQIPALCFSLNENDLIQTQIRSVRNEWNNRSESQLTVVVLADDDLVELELTHVTTIIHVEMPLRKLDAFGERHRCMWNYFPDLTDKNVTNEVPELRSYVLLSPDEPELDKIITQLRLLNAEIPEGLQNIALQMRERGLSAAAVCKGIKLYGKCNSSNKRLCDRTSRHFLSKHSLRAAATVPKFTKGRVEVSIVHCFDVNQYLGLVQEFYEVRNGKKVNRISYVSEQINRLFDLTKFYEEKANRKLAVPQPGGVYGIKYNMDGKEYYTRALFVQEVPVPKQKSVNYRFFCIDLATFTQEVPDSIFFLPEEFGVLPPLAVNIILANIKPVGNEEEFRRTGLKDIYKNKLVSASVLLSIENTIWVNTMVFSEKGPSGSKYPQMSARHMFLNRNAAEDNPVHMHQLYEQCQRQGFSCSLYKAVEQVDEDFQSIADQFHCAFVPISTVDDPKPFVVLPTFVISPDYIYVTKETDAQLLHTLEDELHNEVLDMIEHRYPHYRTLFALQYEVKLCVAFLDDGGRWRRGIISEVATTDGVTLIDVMCVDHGQHFPSLSLDRLFLIPKKYVIRLPFQAVALKLTHIEPIDLDDLDESIDPDEFWPDEVVEYLASQLETEGGESPRRFDAVVISQPNLDDTFCPSYQAFMLEVGKADEVGKILVQNDLARYTSHGKQLLDKFEAGMLKRMNETVKSEIQADETTDDSSDNSEDENLAEDVTKFDDDLEVNLGNDSRFLATIFEDMGVPTRFVDEVKSKCSAMATPCSSQKSVKEDDKGETSASTKKSNKNESDVNDKDTGETSAQKGIKNESDGKAKEETSMTKSTKQESSSLETSITTKHPEVRWSQTSSFAMLKICIPDLKEYNLKMENENSVLVFDSIVPKNYSFTIRTYGKVTVGDKKLSGQYLAVKLEKLTTVKWERFHWDDEKAPRWLKCDFDAMDSNDDDSDEDYEVELNRQFNNLLRAPSCSMEDSFQPAESEMLPMVDDNEEEVTTDSDEEEIARLS